jgi:hypothetical protein
MLNYIRTYLYVYIYLYIYVAYLSLVCCRLGYEAVYFDIIMLQVSAGLLEKLIYFLLFHFV